MKCCPFCAEAIQDAAIKCRYCGEFLDGRTRTPPALPQKEATPWYFRTANLIITCLILGPLSFLCLPLVWWHPNMSRVKKIILSIVIVAFSLIQIWACAAMAKTLRSYYDQLSQLLTPP